MRQRKAEDKTTGARRRENEFDGRWLYLPLKIASFSKANLLNFPNIATNLGPSTQMSKSMENILPIHHSIWYTSYNTNIGCV